jgi:hypothetical protein
MVCTGCVENCGDCIKYSAAAEYQGTERALLLVMPAKVTLQSRGEHKTPHAYISV